MKALIETLKSWGPSGAFIIAFIDGLGVPNPGMLDYYIAFLGAVRPELAYLTAALATVGSLAGALGLFWMARKGGEKFLDRRIHTPRGRKFLDWFRRFGLVTVFVPALVPILPLPMKAFVVAAGAFRVSPLTFLGVMALGRIPRYFGLAWLGRHLGDQSAAWLKAHLREFALGALALAVLLFLSIRLWERLTRKPSPESIN